MNEPPDQDSSTGSSTFSKSLPTLGLKFFPLQNKEKGCVCACAQNRLGLEAL